MTRDKRLASRLLVPAFACLGVLGLALPAAVKGQPTIEGVFPAEPKVAFDHDNVTPNPVDHLGNPVSNTNPMPWIWHPQINYPNVAGVRFVLKYDPYEVNITGIAPSPVFPGVANIPTIPVINTPTAGQPVPANSLPAAVTGTLWIGHPTANASGIQVSASNPVPLFSLAYQPRHTSHFSDPQFNSEVDVQVSNLTPIIHATTGMVQHVIQWGQPGGTGPWNAEAGSTFGVLVPPSHHWWSPLNSATAPSPNHVNGPGTVVPTSANLVNPFTFPLFVWTTSLVNPVTVPPGTFHAPTALHLNVSAVIQPSQFFASSPVTGQHGGLGIDHIPEPVTAAMFGLGAAAMLLRRRTRRA